jgi:deoxyribose-phosphate aldolase
VPVRDIPRWIDHTLLRPEATAGEIDRLCDEALAHRFVSVCVNPVWTARCAARLAGSGVAVASVVGFPLGAGVPSIKAAEAARAVRDGAAELDMVAALGHLRGGDWGYVADDIDAVVRAAGVPVKVIIESALLTPEEIVRASAIARDAGARFVKTSTGFHPAGGATTEAVELIRRTVGETMGVKAAGGVRDCATALRMIAAGATRIGTSSGVRIAGCLGRVPLPVARSELLALAERHHTECTAAETVPEIRQGAAR